MSAIDQYSFAHLIVAGIRISEHRNAAPPSVDELCQLLSFSSEQMHRMCRILEGKGVIHFVEGAYGLRVVIKDHLKMEALPKETGGSALQQAVADFKKNQGTHAQKIASIKAAQAERKKQLFEDMQRKLKKQLEKNSR